MAEASRTAETMANFEKGVAEHGRIPNDQEAFDKALRLQLEAIREKTKTTEEEVKECMTQHCGEAIMAEEFMEVTLNHQAQLSRKSNSGECIWRMGTLDRGSGDQRRLKSAWQNSQLNNQETMWVSGDYGQVAIGLFDEGPNTYEILRVESERWDRKKREERGESTKEDQEREN